MLIRGLVAAPPAPAVEPFVKRTGATRGHGATRAHHAVLVEASDEWQATDRRYLSEATIALLATPPSQEGMPPRN